MKRLIRLANFFAKHSVPLWSSNAIMRQICRKGYRWLAESRFWYRKAMLERGFTDKELKIASELRYFFNTYPPLYDDLTFAPWEEIADPDNPQQYNLISSGGGQVIRRSPSYCAWKIYELTGKYPKRISQKRFDACDWVEFLDEAGYSQIVDHPHGGHHYVGVIPGEGEFGQVVWFGGLDTRGNYLCSTYNAFRFEAIKIDHERRDVIWVQID